MPLPLLAAGLLGGAGGASPLSGLTQSTPSTATQGPVAGAPISVNVAGFGGRASGSATQSLTQAEPDRGDAFPATTIGDVGAVLPGWVLPAGGLLLLLALVGAFVRRR